jgi:hypothetical protein
MEYNINQAGDNFRIEGDWHGEVMGLDRQGNPGNKERPLYQPGDVFVVDTNGWLRKTDEVHALLLKHQSNKTKQSQQPDQNT